MPPICRREIVDVTAQKRVRPMTIGQSLLVWVGWINPACRSADGTNPLARLAFYASDVFQSTVTGQRRHATAFAVSEVQASVGDKTLTTAGLRGSRAA